jgi:homoserine O-acetyltransferase/O-succinyltransferase
MDYFDPFAQAELDLARVGTRFPAISFDSDWRFGSEHSRYMRRRRAARRAELAVGARLVLLAGEEYHRVIADALSERAANVAGAARPEAT